MIFNGHKQIRILAAMMTALVLMFGSAGALSEAAPATRAVEMPIFQESKVLPQPRNTASFWFSFPKDATLLDAALKLHLSASETLIPERSTITLSLNSEEVATGYITDIVKNPGGIWEVPIPPNLIRKDGILNELTFFTAQRSIEGDCADIDNPANWVKLHSDSSVRFTISQTDAPVLSETFVRFFDTFENTGTLSAEFITGPSPTEVERAALLTIAAAIGKAYPYRDDLSLQAAQGEGYSPFRNKIYIGRNALSTAPFSFTLPNLSQEQETGHLAITSANGVNRLIVAGSDEQGIEKAATLLTSQALLAQADTQALTITSSVLEPARSNVRKESGYYTLADFGYDTINLAGAFHQTAVFYIPQPSRIQGGKNSYVELSFRHSEALISDNSLLTVYVGGAPLGSVKLSSGNANGGKVKVKIPGDALQKENIEIKVEVYNYIGRLDCSKDYSDTAWTAIEKSSVIYLEPGEHTIRPTLLSFPILSQGASQTIVAGPEVALPLAAAIAVRAGQANRHAGSWRFVDTAALENPSAQADYIILADNEHASSLPEAIKEALWILPQGNDAFTASSEVSVLTDSLKDKVVVQVIRSPWNFDNRVYVVTYPSGMEGEAQKLLQKGGTYKKLEGQATVLSATGNAAPFAADQTQTADHPPLTLERVAYLIKLKTGRPITLWIALLVILLAIVLLIVKVMRNKQRFGDAAKNVRKTNAPENEDASCSADTDPSGNENE